MEEGKAKVRVVEKMRTDMAEHEIVDVPADLLKGVKRGEVFLGDCVNQAKSFYFAHNDVEGITFVIGACYNDLGDPYGHAWVEVGSLVFDGVRQRFFRGAGYHQTMKTVPVRQLTGREADVFLLTLPEGHAWQFLLAPLNEKHGNALIIDNKTGFIARSSDCIPNAGATGSS
jgi:hypothetical protein